VLKNIRNFIKKYLMQLTEQHIIRTNEWRDWCVKAKNLYNQVLYYWRQSMFKNIEYFTEYEISGLFAEFNEESFRALPSTTSQQIIRQVFHITSSWKKAKKEYAKNPFKFTGKPKMPKYKKELSELYFTSAQVKLKNGYAHFPQMIGGIVVKTNLKNIDCCRVIPKSNHFVVEFIYTIDDVVEKEYNNKVLGIDLGMNNLAACITNIGQSFLINGKPLKSINQFYNKKKANLQSKLKSNIHSSKRIERLTFKRNSLIKNHLHNASKYIIDKAKELDISHIVIGNNKQWKTEINLGKKTNQNFVSIPHSYLINQIEYKAKKAGIKVTTTEESYTSKCSFLDLEPIDKHEKYLGKRTKRGLFRTFTNRYINADCNGAGNILRKVIGDFEINDSIERAASAPSKINVFEQNTLKSKKFINSF